MCAIHVIVRRAAGTAGEKNRPNFFELKTVSAQFLPPRLNPAFLQSLEHLSLAGQLRMELEMREHKPAPQRLGERQLTEFRLDVRQIKRVALHPAAYKRILRKTHLLDD